MTKKEAILEEVLELIHENASQKFTMKNLAEQLNRSKSSLYEYFSSKDEMITEALEHLIETNVKVIIRSNEDSPFRTRLKSYFLRYMMLAENKRMLQNVVYHPDINTLPIPLQKQLQEKIFKAQHEVSQYFWAIMDKGLEEQILTGPISAERKLVLRSMMLGSMIEFSHFSLPLDKEAYADELLESMIVIHQKPA